MEQVRSGQVSQPSGARRLPSRGSVPVRLASGAPRSKNSPHPLQCTTSRVDSQKHTGTTQVGWLYCHTRTSVEPKRRDPSRSFAALPTAFGVSVPCDGDAKATGDGVCLPQRHRDQ